VATPIEIGGERGLVGRPPHERDARPLSEVPAPAGLALFEAVPFLRIAQQAVGGPRRAAVGPLLLALAQVDLAA
jgi:hypothetical protein